MSLTFKGGLHPEDNKSFTKDKEVIRFCNPKEVVIPLSQHIGAPCDALVKQGDEVFVGQIIGDSEAFVSVPVHSSVSGVVKAVENGRIIIENDEKYTVHPDVKPVQLSDMSKNDVISHIRKAGIVGMGGATFPTFIKLSPNKKIDTVIVNGAECEPFLTSDYRLMIENPKEVVEGLKIVADVLEAEKAVIAIEDNKKDAFDKISKFCEGKIEAKLVKTKYPQGSEKQLIDSVLKRQVKAGKLPSDVGVVVVNVATVKEIFNYFKTGLPLIERIVTVSGSGVKNPCNLLVRIGTKFSDILDYAGINEGVKKVISGGPMMGFSQYSLDVPVTKGTSGILLFTDKEDKEYDEKACIKCGKCVEHCPMRLMPFMITEYARINNFEESVKYGLKDCIECGACSYICPQRRYLVQTIKTAKSKLPR